MSSAHILVVDDEPDIRGLLKEILEDEGTPQWLRKIWADVRDGKVSV